ncbi:unnamed protein product [Durusdinium trenchii]|uniref:RNA-dependent RNA polymerase n=2 Tax=Durusdinium trenchii TaxID=1381693 RepID=A0ABP0SN08_9DINO
MALVEGQRVNVTGGKYAGKVGTVTALTPKMVKLDLDGQEVTIMQSSVKPMPSDPTSAPEPESKVVPDRSPVGYPAEASKTDEQKKLNEGDRVAITGGKHQGETGVVEKWNKSKATIKLDGNHNDKSVQVEHHYVSFGSSCPTSVATTAPQTPLEEFFEDNDEPQSFSIYERVKKIILGDDKKTEECFLDYHFSARTVIMEKGLGRKGFEPPSKVIKHHGDLLHLVSVKVEKDGLHFWGGPKYCIRCAYVKETPGRALEDEFEELASFSDLKSARKVASRLELLQSPGHVVSGFTAANLEAIPEPLTKASGGCGFINQRDLQRLTEHLGTRTEKFKAATSVQVRIFGARVGVLKGVLTLKEGIEKIQFAKESMQKVGPSRISSDDQVWVVVTKVFPSATGLQIGKWLKTGRPQKALKEKQKKLSPMVERVLKSLEISSEELERHKKEEFRQEAFVVGVADPTGQLPEGQIFISGLQEQLLSQGMSEVLVTRCPCVRPSDGKRLRVVTCRPPGMAEEAWRFLTSRSFGEVIFPRASDVGLPELIAEGDLDGDLYWICWNAKLVATTQPDEVTEAEGAEAPPTLAGRGPPLGGGWLKAAQLHMLAGEVLKEGQLIGRIYRAAEKRAIDHGLRDPDAQALFRAYVQSIDTGKHGNSIEIPQHLRKEVGLQ